MQKPSRKKNKVNHNHSHLIAFSALIDSLNWFFVQICDNSENTDPKADFSFTKKKQMESRASYPDANKITAVDMNAGANHKRIMEGSVGSIQSKGNSKLGALQENNETKHSNDLKDRLSFTFILNNDSMQIDEDHDNAFLDNPFDTLGANMKPVGHYQSIKQECQKIVNQSLTASQIELDFKKFREITPALLEIQSRQPSARNDTEHMQVHPDDRH